MWWWWRDGRWGWWGVWKWREGWSGSCWVGKGTQETSAVCCPEARDFPCCIVFQATRFPCILFQAKAFCEGQGFQWAQDFPCIFSQGQEGAQDFPCIFFKAKKEPKAVSSSKAKKEPKTSRVSEDKGTVKACSEGDGGEPMESNKSKPKMKANKKRTISENVSSRPASRPRRSRSVPSRDGNLQKEIKEIQSFTEALDYHNLEFDDLKFYIKEAVTQQFEFKITQLNIYWKTARCGIRMYRADGKSTDPFSFTFPSDSGGHLLRMVVSVATAAHMVTSLYLHIENMFYVFVGWKVSVHPTDSCGPLCFKLVRSHHCLDLRPSASRMLGTWWNLMMTWTTWTDWPSTTGVLELKCFAVWVLLMLTKFQLLTYCLWGVSLCCHARHGASLGSAQCHHDCAMFVTTWAYIPNFLGAMKFDVRSRVHLLIGSLGTVPMTFAIEFNFSYAFKMISLSNINHVFSEPWLSQATQFLRPCHHPSVLGAAG